MKSTSSILIQFLMIQYLFSTILSVEFDFFYLRLEWPGSRCKAIKGCCYPTTGKPAHDFIINKLEPAIREGRDPTFCDPDSNLDLNMVLNLKESLQKNWPSLDCPSNDGVLNWSENWRKYGTCSGFDQYEYFELALNLRNELNLLNVLKDVGIKPSRDFFSLKLYENAIKNVTGYTPGFRCILDRISKGRQLYRVYICVDNSGSGFVECPKYKSSMTCKDSMKIPLF